MSHGGDHATAHGVGPTIAPGVAPSADLGVASGVACFAAPPCIDIDALFSFVEQEVILE